MYVTVSRLLVCRPACLLACLLSTYVRTFVLPSSLSYLLQMNVTIFALNLLFPSFWWDNRLVRYLPVAAYSSHEIAAIMKP